MNVVDCNALFEPFRAYGWEWYGLTVDPGALPPTHLLVFYNDGGCSATYPGGDAAECFALARRDFP